MKLPRDLSGMELARLLRAVGYEITRQTGSHLRLTTEQRGEHQITIPNHFPLKRVARTAVFAVRGSSFETRKDADHETGGPRYQLCELSRRTYMKRRVAHTSRRFVSGCMRHI